MRLQSSLAMNVLAVSFVVAAACSDDAAPDPEAGDGSAGNDAMQPGAGTDAATSGDAGSRSDAGRTDGGSPADGGGDPEDPVELPEGSREHGGVVNLVDAAAAAQLEEFLTSRDQVHVALRQGLTEPVNLFLEHYLEVYDFLFVFTDHSVPGGVVGKFETINVHAAPGGAADIELAAGGYRSDGRLKGVVGIQWRTPVGPPISHELMHYWAVHLDTRLGFGSMLGGQDPAHWGFTSVHGQLGGFDRDALRCETPAGASPPDCTALGSGRFRYVVPSFFPNSNPAVPYAPLELYLMGLIPGAEVPSTFQLLEEAEIVADSYDDATGTVVVEAAAIGAIAFDDIVSRHGEIEERAADDRHFTAAFVVVSAQPAPDEVLDDVAEWAAAFGNRGTSQVVIPFETLTGGRATLDTRLGPRRGASEPAPEPGERLTCDLLAQDCPREELACYGFSVPICALSGGVAQAASCDSAYACDPGFDCLAGSDDPDAYVCTPYCEPDDASHAKACQTLCPGAYVRVRDAQQQTLGAFCAP